MVRATPSLLCSFYDATKPSPAGIHALRSMSVVCSVNFATQGHLTMSGDVTDHSSRGVCF